MMKSGKLQGIVRLAVTICLVVYVLNLVAECAAINVDYPDGRDYDNEPRRRTKPRESRGFKPHSMSTAIGFGKRHSNSLQSSKHNGRETLTPLKDFSDRFPIEWLAQFFKLYPGIIKKIEKNILTNGGKAGASIVQRYRKNKSNDEAYYYDED